MKVSGLEYLIRDAKKYLPKNSGELIAQIQENFPEIFISGCQFSPGFILSILNTDIKYDLANQFNTNFSNYFGNFAFSKLFLIQYILLPWYYTQNIVSFDKDFSKELIKTKNLNSIDINEFKKLIGNPIYIPYDNEINKCFGTVICISSDEDTLNFSCYVVQSKENEINIISIDGNINKLKQTTINELKNSFIENFKNLGNGLEIFNKLVFLLSDEPESINWRKDNLNFIPKIKKHKKRTTRVYAPEQPKLKIIGFNFGEQIRNASLNKNSDKTIRPHIRSAHWHTYLIGKGKIKKCLKWLAPIYVHSYEKIQDI